LIDIAVKSLASGIFTGLILWLSQTRFGPMAGMLLFFPVISVPTFFFLGNGGDPEALRRAVLWGFWGIPSWCLFALTVYVAAPRLKTAAAAVQAARARRIAHPILSRGAAT
jgi:uncharacterized membrane protein (GlpM family)